MHRQSTTNNWSFKNNKSLYITGAIALGTAAIYTFSYLLKKFKTITLNKWLDEYLSEIKDQFREVKNKEIYPEQFTASVMNLVNEIQNFLYMKENSDLEKERIGKLGDDKLYEEAVSQTVETHEKYYLDANSVIKSKTGIDVEKIKSEQLPKVSQFEFKKFLMSEKKNYFPEDMPKLDKSRLREAYIFYAKTYTQHARISAEQMSIMQTRPEYQEVAFKTIFQNKFLLKDLITTKYGVDSRFLTQMVVESGLLEDSEVNYYYEDVKRSHNISG
jgi:hypothetical protein